MVLSNSLDRGLKRSVVSLSSEQEHFFNKRQRLEATANDLSNCLTNIVQEPQLAFSPCSTDSFTFGEMVTGFGSDPCIAESENANPILDNFLVDLPIVAESSVPLSKNQQVPKVQLATSQACIMRHEITSPVSSSSPAEQTASVPDLPTASSTGRSAMKPHPVSTSPVSSSPSRPTDMAVCKKQEHTVGDTAEMDQFHEKRMADRAARNRESSRRAREKAKQRLRALENQNHSLLDMVQYFRSQNEALFSQLHRARTMQQNCSMCSYNNGGQTPPPVPEHPPPTHGAMRLDRCAGEKCRPQSYSGSV